MLSRLTYREFLRICRICGPFSAQEDDLMRLLVAHLADVNPALVAKIAELTDEQRFWLRQLVIKHNAWIQRRKGSFRARHTLPWRSDDNR